MQSVIPRPLLRQAHRCLTSVPKQSLSTRTFLTAQRVRTPTAFKSKVSQSTPPSRLYTSQQTSQGARDKAAVGPFTVKAALVFVVTGLGLYAYFENEKSKIQEKKKQEYATSSVGRPNIGGPFSLVTHENKPFTQDDILGKFSLIYFGFTNCPDICPEELDKMSAVVEEADKTLGEEIVQPIFISCDPARDTVEQTAQYVSDFHPRLIGLTGTYDDVKKACKSYRVYFSTPPDASPNDDYLVDHSIFFYLMDPKGQFVDAFGKNSTTNDVTKKLLEAVQKYKATGKAI